ncbi:hypothetical protein [Pedobacter gandavensis]|uniref:hypothetical protein n=1 Tax=Pedobacter gandavensis TaxID=2679963 RepID=UPI0029301DBE|nr:hypothetical protein [Pedobacter gandavensis]
MKRLTLILTLLLVAMFGSSLLAQENNTTAADTSRAQNVFIELGGQGLTFTANYDSRFSKKRDGLGGRAGIGYLSINDERVTSIPFSLNYLLGKNGKYFELGLGTTLFYSTGFKKVFSMDNKKKEYEAEVVGTMSFFYRVQPEDSGFAFRIGLSPVFGKDYFIPYYGGLSLGYTF